MEEILKELNEKLEKLICIEEDGLKKKLEKAFKENATLSIKKYDSGKSEVQIEGSTLGILIALAGLEKIVLKRLNVPKGLYELIKYRVGTKEDK